MTTPVLPHASTPVTAHAVAAVKRPEFGEVTVRIRPDNGPDALPVGEWVRQATTMIDNIGRQAEVAVYIDVTGLGCLQFQALKKAGIPVRWFVRSRADEPVDALTAVAPVP